MLSVESRSGRFSLRKAWLPWTARYNWNCYVSRYNVFQGNILTLASQVPLWANRGDIQEIERRLARIKADLLCELIAVRFLSSFTGTVISLMVYRCLS